MKHLVFFLILLSTLSLHTFAQTTTEKDLDNIKDPVTELREQIEGAATPAEKIRLQLKLADLLVTTGQKSDALKELQLIADSNTFDPGGFYNLGNSYARLGETEAAISAYNTAIEQRKGRYSRAYNNLGVVLFRAGRWDEAYDALLSALKVENFRYAEASYNLGRVYSARGQKDLAAREWRRALAVDPQHDAAAYALSRVGTEDKIVVEPKPAKAAPEPKTTSVKIVEKKPAPAPAPAAVSAPKSLSLDQASFDFMQKARNAAERGKMTEAVDNFRRVLNRQDGYFPPANLELSYALLSLKRYDEALPHLLEVSQRDGARYPISYFHLARVYELKGELKLAEAAFVQAAPNNPQFLLDVSRVREKLGDFKGALTAVEQYLTLQGTKPAWSDTRIAELRRKAGQ
ncbi:MAG TPA: tetratricopeptide repeat protein [Pyrinomonadaceae bacterium]|nr:tetratricopeptide repeat protein [Pyrinomonadaceae bacterium]